MPCTSAPETLALLREHLLQDLCTGPCPCLKILPQTSSHLTPFPDGVMLVVCVEPAAVGTVHASLMTRTLVWHQRLPFLGSAGLYPNMTLAR